MPIYVSLILSCDISHGADVSAHSESAPSAYLCGNSLGLLAKRSEELVLEELKVWGTRYALLKASFDFHSRATLRAVEGHFDHPHERPWVKMTDHVNPLMADVIGK